MLKVGVWKAEVLGCQLAIYTVTLFFISVPKDYNQLESKEFLWLTSYAILSGKYATRNQGKNLYSGTEAENMAECCLLACSQWLSQSALSYKPGPLAQGCYKT